MNSTEIAKELDSALHDVRKAYRLLWYYQRRVFDICQEIARQFTDVEFYHSHYYFGGTPRRTPINDQVWRMLPMSRINFLYCKHKEPAKDIYPQGSWNEFPRKGDYLLDLYVVSDTGIIEYSGKGEPDPTKFIPPTESKSQLTLYFFMNDLDRNEPTNWYYKIWNGTKYPDHDSILAHESINGIRIYGYTYDLKEMYSKEAIQSCVDKFKNKLKEQLNIDIKSEGF